MILIRQNLSILLFSGVSMNIKKKIWNLVKCILFLAVLGLVISSVYNVLKWKNTNIEYLSSVEQLYNTPEGLIDVVFMGSSHCYCGVHPAVLWREYGIAAFDMSISGQDKDSAYHDLVELYKTQSPSVIYVDLYALLFDEHLVESNVYRNYLSLNTSPNSIALVNKYIPDEDRKAFYFRFPIIHTRYRELKKYDFLTYPPNTFGRGEYYELHIGGSWEDPAALDDSVIGDLSDKNRSWLTDMISLAEAHDTKMEFMVLPFAVTPAEQEILNAAEAMLEAEHYPYTDFNKLRERLGIILQRDFSDQFHLNIYGAEKLTSFLAKSLTEKYNLPDHRGDAEYQQWEDDLRWYENVKIRNKMVSATSPHEYVSGIIQFWDGVTVVSLDGDFLDSEIDYFEVLEPLGMDYDEYLSGGKWIYEDGVLQKIGENTQDAPETYYDLSRYDRLRVGYFGTLNPDNIMIGRDGYQTSYPLTFVTYDTFLEEIVMSRGF